MSTLLSLRGGGGFSATKFIAGVPLHASEPHLALKHLSKNAAGSGSVKHGFVSSTTAGEQLGVQNNSSPPRSIHATSGILQWKGINTLNVPSTRQLHSDVQFPDFDSYRLESTKDPNKPARESADMRRMAQYGLVYGVGGMFTMLIGKDVLNRVVIYKSMTADQRALASVEIDLSTVPEGTTKTFEWRGKPVFVRHRSPKEVEELRSVDVQSLRHPQSDEERTKKPEWSIVIGVCTHLGCIPIAGAGDFNGYFCPCHGSHYDGSGRIRKGPAPLNLNVPEYSFVDDNTAIVGKS